MLKELEGLLGEAIPVKKEVGLNDFGVEIDPQTHHVITLNLHGKAFSFLA